MNVLRMARAMNIELKNILLVGCEPETLGGEEGQMGLSAPVEAAVDEAVKLVESLVNRILNGNGPDRIRELGSKGCVNRYPERQGDAVAMENGNGSFSDRDTLFMLEWRGADGFRRGLDSHQSDRATIHGTARSRRSGQSGFAGSGSLLEIARHVTTCDDRTCN